VRGIDGRIASRIVMMILMVLMMMMMIVMVVMLMFVAVRSNVSRVAAVEMLIWIDRQKAW
jgi:hypothetical protein